VRAAVDSRQCCQEDQQDLRVCHGGCRGLERAKGSLRGESRETRGFRKMHLEIVSSSLIGHATKMVIPGEEMLSDLLATTIFWLSVDGVAWTEMYLCPPNLRPARIYAGKAHCLWWFVIRRRARTETTRIVLQL